METIDISRLTPQQRAQMLARLQQAEAEARLNREREIAAYRDLVDETVTTIFPRLQAISSSLAESKRNIREAFEAVLDMKAELFGTREGGQFSHQFMDRAGRLRIRIGFNTVDNYDDTVGDGIAMVCEYINSLARDPESRMLVDTVMRLLSKDAKGTLKASRVLQLQQMAERSGEQRFIEGVRIIRDAYRPIETKSYLRAEYRDANGAWRSVPLGMTEAE